MALESKPLFHPEVKGARDPLDRPFAGRRMSAVDHDYAIEKPSNKLLAVAELDSETWVGEFKCIRRKNPPRPTTSRPQVLPSAESKAVNTNPYTLA